MKLCKQNEHIHGTEINLFLIRADGPEGKKKKKQVGEFT